ncbi:endonuclease Q family protein [Aneurinibacillus sp. Ricciae_BoGa-3]|uniref:endonuclease Q family protein n=1 Tax=Aneurinibacillus sp. Ricciae_BoGa-3 TaxID=3022697 RepID=UPI00234123BD|nr:endonuclease Q family protein [Aneurinibacillus sp. Ricciae_BoGa-3]WCK55958.1 endonuclease Q family protein [Aneurinibacillus sp. Ricciae_BoGa-3]
MKECFADLHIHIGRTMYNRAVKITASRNLTFTAIMEEALSRKGMHIVGIIDCHSPEVQEEIDLRIKQGILSELEDGGYRYSTEQGDITIIAGVEVELHVGHGLAHFLVYLPDRVSFASFREWYASKVTNVHLSTQRMYVELTDLVEKTLSLGGIVIPAHAFTPYKGVYGACVDSLAQVVDVAKLAALELGLSSDSTLADGIDELWQTTYVSNSDAHSIAKIGREYQDLRVAHPSFFELKLALARQEGRGVQANYGLHPQLGKYYRSRCASCDEIIEQPDVPRCPYCGKEGKKVITHGVYDRFKEISTHPVGEHPEFRPPYKYQVPLEFVPGLGPGRMNKLLQRFGTEMNILHHVPAEELAEAVEAELAGNIERSRTGNVAFVEGGGGIYGKVSL